MNIISAITRTLPGGFRSYIKVQREKGALLKISLPAAVLLVTILLMAAVQVRAAFPYDMEEKALAAKAVDPSEDVDVIIFNDSDLMEYKETVPADEFKIRIHKAEGEALYGDYESADGGGSGWISADSVMFDPEFDHVYATVRDKMSIYTDSSCTSKRTSIKKYSGVILIGKEGKSRQVIYDKGDRYAIGWMKREEYKNSLKYDGRPKQVLADGAYHFRCGYRDDGSGGGLVQPEYEACPDQVFILTHLENDCYRICDQKTGRYLQVKGHWSRRTWTWSPVWKKEPDDRCGTFRIARISGSVSIQNTLSGGFYARSPEGRELLMADSGSIYTHWRPASDQRMVNLEQPFVFTQYDPQWCASPYGSEGCIGTSGCGILAPVNAVYSLSGQYMDVMELADYAVDKHYRVEGSGTREEVFAAFARRFGKKYGFAWDGHSNKLKTLKKKLKEGKVAVVYVPGHYVCISAYDEKTDRYLLLDSNCLPKRKDTPYGDWIKADRLKEGSLQSQGYYFYKLRDIKY